MKNLLLTAYAIATIGFMACAVIVGAMVIVQSTIKGSPPSWRNSSSTCCEEPTQ